MGGFEAEVLTARNVVFHSVVLHCVSNVTGLLPRELSSPIHIESRLFCQSAELPVSFTSLALTGATRLSNQDGVGDSRHIDHCDICRYEYCEKYSVKPVPPDPQSHGKAWLSGAHWREAS